jgi:hypothetical protein
MSTEGECDAEFGRRWIRLMTWTVPRGRRGGERRCHAFTWTPIFSKRDCVSPRLVSLIILKQFRPRYPPQPIEAFAGFFVEGCEVETTRG